MKAKKILEWLLMFLAKWFLVISIMLAAWIIYLIYTLPAIVEWCIVTFYRLKSWLKHNWLTLLLTLWVLCALFVIILVAIKPTFGGVVELCIVIAGYIVLFWRITFAGVQYSIQKLKQL